MPTRPRSLRARRRPAFNLAAPAPSMIVGYNSRPVQRFRTRHNVTLDPRHVERLRERVAQAAAAGNPSSFSREIGRAVDQAEGVLNTLGHAIQNDLLTATHALDRIRRELQRGHRIDVEDFQPIVQAVARAVGRCQPAAPPAAYR